MYRQLFIISDSIKARQIIKMCSLPFTSMIKDGMHRREYVNYYQSTNNDGTPLRYSNNTLDVMSMNAYNMGNKYFFAVPADESDPFGDMVESEPLCVCRSEIWINYDLYKEWIANDNAMEVDLRSSNNIDGLLGKLSFVEGKDYFAVREENGRICGVAFRPMLEEEYAEVLK